MDSIEKYFYDMFILYDNLHYNHIISDSLYNDLCSHGEDVMFRMLHTMSDN